MESAGESVPLVFTVDEQMAHFLGLPRYPTADEVEVAGGRVGRDYYPALVFDLLEADLLLPEVASVVVPSAWSDVELPSRAIDEDGWRLLFDLAGYTVEGVRSERPSDPLTLWRGALPECRNGWSWTDDPIKARWFADHPRNKGHGRVWVANVEPSRLLARITQQRPGESEYVVDARGLTVTPA